MNEFFKKIKIKRILFIAALLVVAWSVFGGNVGFFAQMRLAHKNRKLVKKIENEKAKVEYLQQEVDSLSDSTNLKKIEEKAREQGMGKKDEMIILVK